jgi:hypothetical protein
MNNEAWVIIWVRAYTDYPTMTSNIASEEIAREMVRGMLADAKVAELITVCPASKLRDLRP